MQFTSHNPIWLGRDEKHAHIMQSCWKVHHRTDFQYDLTFQLTLHQIVIHGMQFKWLLTAKNGIAFAATIRTIAIGTRFSYKLLISDAYEGSIMLSYTRRMGQGQCCDFFKKILHLSRPMCVVLTLTMTSCSTVLFTFLFSFAAFDLLWDSNIELIFIFLTFFSF